MSVVSISDKVKFIESVFGTGKLSRDGRNFDVRCPICAPSDKQKRKLSILLENDGLHCWSCGYKAYTLAPLVRKYSNREKLSEYRDRFMPDTKRNCRTFHIDVAEPEKLKLPDDFKLIVTSSMRDPDALSMRKYLTIKRRISERDMWYFKLGYSNEPRWQRRVIVPSFDANGELNYFVGRAIDKFRRPKYDNPDNDKLPIIFNELNVDWRRELVLVEGAFDMMKCPDNTVPMLGSDLNEEGALFNAILVHGTPIALALDADMKVKKTPKIAKKLTEYDVPVRIVKVPTDPGDMTKQEFCQCLDEAKPFTWSDTFMDKLDSASRVSLYR